MDDIQVLSREAPLVFKYFFDHLKILVEASRDNGIRFRFENIISNPGPLERRLQRIEHLSCTSGVIQEIGDINDPEELNGRLIDAWAELRVLDQLVREDYTNPIKVKSIADLLASNGDKSYAIQVKRIRSSYVNQVARRNPQGKRNASAIGSIDDIHDRLDKPLAHCFWDGIEEKNRRFKDWPDKRDNRVIAIVSSDERMSDSMIRHIACQQIAKSIFELLNINFEEIWWFPDLSNGCRIYVGDDFASTRCVADWCDDIFGPDSCDSRPVKLAKVDLSSRFR
jgi:hypothetical protein